MPPQVDPAAPPPVGRPPRNRRAPVRSDGTRVGQDDASPTAVPVPAATAVPRGRATNRSQVLPGRSPSGEVFDLNVSDDEGEDRPQPQPQPSNPPAESSLPLIPPLPGLMDLHANHRPSPA
ncbi:hypothetical protein BDN72DRAFT_906325 [Pluteus cervinus]|uniref:Uncharacterized protein n=1 Tax=Pluteus cervinus TaxID=181527 RepID=A0ACD2ZZP5_9AGAR|nr:hypothetical protein BDN72DRAFT_906325 [Pluteus cervinus]